MGWDDLGIPDMENIPAGYLVTWPFINAFFLAFQERADYIEQAARAETYDDLLLTGPQISTAELTNRLSSLNDKVLSCFDNTIWVKEQTWTDFKAHTVGLTTSSGPGLGVIDIEEWDEDAIKVLLTDDVYEFIFTDYAYEVNFQPSYWSGLYKLLEHVMLYRSASLNRAAAPDPVTEPYIVANGYKTGQDFRNDLDVDAAVAAAQAQNPPVVPGGINISRTFISADSQSFGGVPIDQCSASIAGYTGNWKLFAPTMMDIVFLIASDQGEQRSTLERVAFNALRDPPEDDILLSNDIIDKPLACSRMQDGDSTVFAPDSTTFFSDKAWNPNFVIGHDGLSTTIDISAASGLADSHGVSVDEAPTGVGITNSRNSGSATDLYRFNYAIAEMPIDDFVFKG